MVSTLAPNFLFANFFDSSSIVDDVPTLLKAARRLRKQGRLNAAKTKYEQVLTLDATEIRAYNGIRKILLAKKNKELQVIQLYQQAVANIPNEKRIKRRLYNQYAKAALGNKKIVDQLNIPNSRPLLFVRQKYEEMLLQGYPNKKNLERELAKINKYISLNVDISDVRKNKELKKHKRDNRNAHKKRFDQLTAQETTVALSALKVKEVSVDRIPQIREMSKVNIAAYRQEKNYVAALAASKDFLDTIDKSDPYFIKQFRELSKQLNGYDDLINFEQYNHSQKGSFWSALSLYDAYFIKSEKQNTTGVAAMDSLIQQMKTKANIPQHYFEIITREIKYNILKNDLISAETKILELCKQKMGISDAHTIDRVNLIIAKYYAKQNDAAKKNQILDIITYPKRYLENPDDFTQHIALLNMNRSSADPLRIQQLQRNINNL
jgi:hypothetical protein